MLLDLFLVRHSLIFLIGGLSWLHVSFILHVKYTISYRIVLWMRKEKKLTRLLFDFSVVNTADDNCEQQVPTVALCLQQLTAPAARRRSCTVYNSCVLTPSRTGGHSDICTFFVRNPTISTDGSVWRESECGNGNSGAKFVIFYSRPNYLSVLLSFRDIITTDDGHNNGNHRISVS